MNTLKFLTTSYLLLFIFNSSLAQKKYNQIQVNEDDEKHLIGLCNLEGLTQAPFQEWYDANYEAYELDEKMLAKCKRKTKNVKVKIFMGTWCGDSKRAVPPFYKVMEELGISEDDMMLVNLDSADEKYKQSPNGEEKGLNIHRVPTFIFYKNDEEIGRIVESPVTSLETDVAQILYDMPTAPNYKGVEALHQELHVDNLDLSQENLLAIARRVYRNVKSDRELNTYGYVLKARDEMDKAIAVFEINRMIFPKIANVYDSLAEAYIENDNMESALFYYEKVLELEPENENALAQLKKLKK